MNEVAAHGIPDDRPLVEGDIVSIDVTVFYKVQCREEQRGSRTRWREE